MPQKRLLKICPVCGKPDLKFLPQHIAQVHNIRNKKERKMLLKQALYSEARLYSNTKLFSPAVIQVGNDEERKMSSSVQHGNKKSNSDEDNTPELVDWVDHTEYYK